MKCGWQLEKTKLQENEESRQFSACRFIFYLSFCLFTILSVGNTFFLYLCLSCCPIFSLPPAS
jgi:hypothetical protein